MADFYDTKYIQILGTRLQKFKQKSASVYSFRCPICNDSHKNPNKTRGYIFQNKGTYFFKCQNCGKSMVFYQFLEYMDSELYSEYQMEKFFQPRRKITKNIVVSNPLVYDTKLFDELPSVASLNDLSPNKQYVINRQIPEKFWSRMFICQEFKTFTNKIIPGKFVDVSMDETRLLIPFYDERKKVIAFTGRSLKPNTKMRYINIVLDENRPKIFGIDSWKKDQETFVFEGPIDSLFIDNAIATAGGDLISAIRDYDKSKFIIVYDNESKSRTTREKIMKSIDGGYRVCIWPNSLKQKDINEMILSGKKGVDIERIIRDNTFEGLEAKLKLTFWR